jgi:hypothetical protein
MFYRGPFSKYCHGRPSSSSRKHGVRAFGYSTVGLDRFRVALRLDGLIFTSKHSRLDRLIATRDSQGSEMKYLVVGHTRYATVVASSRVYGVRVDSPASANTTYVIIALG